MSFVTFSQRTLASASIASKTRFGARRTSQVPAHRTLVAMYDIVLEGVVWHGPRQAKFQLPRAGLRECRAFHKYMRKIGVNIPARKTGQHIAALTSFVKAKASEFPGSRACSPVSSDSNPTLLVPKSKLPAYITLDSPSHVHPDSPGEPGSSEPSLRSTVDPLLSKSRTSSTLSMSCRRHAASLPSLQRHLSFTMSRFFPADGNGGEYMSEAFVPVDLCSTPITPFDQIIHTPLYPPSLKRPEVKRTVSHVPVQITEDSVLYSYSTSRFSTPSSALSKVSENIRRRPSAASPPVAKPMHAPRRLSYSHTYRSPLKRRTSAVPNELLNSCAETSTSDLLASPLVIVPSSSSKLFESAAWVDNDGYRTDFSFHLRGSPLHSSEGVIHMLDVFTCETQHDSLLGATIS